MNEVKTEETNNVKVGGIPQQPVQKAVDPNTGVGRQPIPGVPLLPDTDMLDPKDLDDLGSNLKKNRLYEMISEEPTTIFPSTRAPATVRQPLAPTRGSSQNTVAQVLHFCFSSPLFLENKQIFILAQQALQ